MAANIDDILKIEVPLIVVLADREMAMDEVVNLTPGTLIELPQLADDDLQILVSNKAIGLGSAVKVGENFGIQINFIGDLKARIEALGPMAATTGSDDDLDADAFADAILAAQM